jgi:hypothetical protein
VLDKEDVGLPDPRLASVNDPLGALRDAPADPVKMVVFVKGYGTLEDAFEDAGRVGAVPTGDADSAGPAAEVSKGPVELVEFAYGTVDGDSAVFDAAGPGPSGAVVDTANDPVRAVVLNGDVELI